MCTDNNVANQTKFKNIFISANEKFVRENEHLFNVIVSERCLCAVFRDSLKEKLIDKGFGNYFVDVEYNKNLDGYKEIFDENGISEKITCDLIVHKRGTSSNLIAIEMKKSTASKDKRNNDRERLKKLTSDDGQYKYILGIYYEFKEQTKRGKNFIGKIEWEYYVNGNNIGNGRCRIVSS